MSKIYSIDGIDFYELSEEDFYPPEDDRVYTSYIEDIDDGESFRDYACWFYETYGDDIFDDGWDYF